MAMSQSHTTRARREQGFSLLETVIALFVLAVGLTALAALMSRMHVGSTSARYMSMAAFLASEKLEDLSRYQTCDPNIVVPTSAGTTAGSLTADITAVNVTTPCTSAISLVVSYSDQVWLSAGNGNISETTSSLDGSGHLQYTTYQQTPQGVPNSSTSTTAPTPSSDTLVFSRRWMIEKDTPVVGVNRITVLVTLVDPAPIQNVSFQMSMVRQYQSTLQ